MTQGVFFSALVKETEAHVLLRLLLGLGLGGGRGGSSTTGRDGRELLAAGSEHLLDVLALQLGQNLGELVGIGVDAGRAEDGLDISLAGGGVAPTDRQQVSSYVPHV